MHRHTGLWAVVGAMAGSMATLISGCDDELSEASYDKVAIGMTLAEVEAMLGPGAKQMGREFTQPKDPEASATPEVKIQAAKPRMALPKRETWAWRDEEGRAILITFVDGKAASKTSKRLAEK